MGKGVGLLYGIQIVRKYWAVHYFDGLPKPCFVYQFVTNQLNLHVLQVWAEALPRRRPLLNSWTDSELSYLDEMVSELSVKLWTKTYTFDTKWQTIVLTDSLSDNTHIDLEAEHRAVHRYIDRESLLIQKQYFSLWKHYWAQHKIDSTTT